MRSSLIWQLVKGEIAEKLDVKVEEADLLAQAKVYAHQQFAQYGMTNMDETTIEDFAKRMLDNEEYRRRLFENVSEGKLFAVVFNAVTIDNKEVTLDEFKEIAQKA